MAGPAGLQVVIRGANFSSTPASNLVRFGAVQAQVLSASADSLVVRVPVSADYQSITVTTAGLTGYCSRPPFRETFGTGGVAFSTGSFGSYANFSQDGPSLSVMDLNGDGKPDLVSGSQYLTGFVQGLRSFSVLTNSSDSGTVAFAAVSHFASSYDPLFCRTADMNGDGRPDVVAWDTTASGSNQIAVFLNNGSGNTISFDGGTAYAYGTGFTGIPSRIVVRDFDGDGKPDVLAMHTVTGDSTTSYLTFLQNTGSGGSVSFTQLTDLEAQSYNGGARTISDFIVADFDNDGKPDILAYQGNGFYVYHNNSTPGTISFAAGAQSNYVTPGTLIFGLTAADLNGDGYPELIYFVFPTDYSNNYQLEIMANGPNGSIPSFGAPHTYATGAGPLHMAVGDLDGDGKPELVISNQTGAVQVFRNTCVMGTSNISFDSPVSYPVSTATSSQADDLAIVDVDGDHRPDIVASMGYTNGGVAILRNLMPPAATPTITAFTPTTATAGTKVGLSGTNFTGALGLSFGGVPATSFTINSADSITAIVANGASGQVTLIAPGGADSVSGFTYTNEPAPIVSSFSPDSVGYYQEITIKGSHFTNLVSATAGGTPLADLTFVSDSVLTGYVTGGGDGYVAVVTTAGADSLSGFTYIPQTPLIYYFTPTSGRPGDTIQLKGYHYTGTTGVSFGGVPASWFQVQNDSMMIAVVGYGASGVVTVTHGYVSGSLNGFTFIEPAPTVTSFSPTSAGQGASVTIKGHYFTGATAVSFGGTAAASFTVSNDSTVVAVVGTGSSGMVSVASPEGSSALAGFTFGVAPPTPAPTVTAFSPTSGKRGDSVLITGHYFTGATAVSFGGTAAASFVVFSDSTVLAVVGTGSTGVVALTTSKGSGSLGTFIFDSTSTAPSSPPDTTSPAPPDTTSPTPPDTTAKPLAFSVASFYGSVTSGESVLIWKAMNDESIAVYTIQEGADSAQLTSIATVNPQHKDSAIYVFRDPTLRNGVAWYRLLAADTSGKQVYSASLSLSLPLLTSTAYPNPANGIIQVSVPNVTVNSVFELADMSGKILLVVQVSPGTNIVQINVSTINTGTYQLSWSDGSRRKTQTVLIMR